MERKLRGQEGKSHRPRFKPSWLFGAAVREKLTGRVRPEGGLVKAGTFPALAQRQAGTHGLKLHAQLRPRVRIA